MWNSILESGWSFLPMSHLHSSVSDLAHDPFHKHLLETWGRKAQERLPGILYYHVRPHLPFMNSLKFQLSSSYLLLWWPSRSTVLCQRWQFVCPVSLWRTMSFSKLVQWLSCNLSSPISSSQLMISLIMQPFSLLGWKWYSLWPSVP